MTERRRILVTGASGAIGGAIALRLAQSGFRVSLHAHTRAQEVHLLKESMASDGLEADVLCFDITQRETCHALLEADMEAHGAYYGVVCNAGTHRDNPFAGLTPEEWDAVLDTNLGGFFNVVQPLILPMIRSRRGGRIVTISSISGVMGNRGQVNYSAAKAGLIGATKALAVELASRNITVNCVAPGLIASDMLAPEVAEQALAAIPMKRIGTPQDVADVVGFLCSDAAGYITRQVIQVNGGMA